MKPTRVLLAVLPFGLLLAQVTVATGQRPPRNKPAPAGAARRDFKLKPGAAGDVCLGCHSDIADLVKKSHVHTPVKQKVCTGCHNPHASDHGKLLAVDAKAICSLCHQVIKKDAVSKHPPVAEGKCETCHDVHASDNPGNLKKPAIELCGSCHGELVNAAVKAKFKHRPLETTGCAACHDPHSSRVEASLLQKNVGQLCAGCHDARAKGFDKVHLGYPVAGTRCTSCHDPHGSDQPGLLLASVHAPVAKRECGQCHEGPGSRTPLATRRAGAELCGTCHSKTMAQMKDKNRVHWAIFGERACLNCHAPHASHEAKLLRADLVTACGSCHADTIDRQARSPTKHKPIASGGCPKCHEPHSSDNVLLLNKVDTIELCATCHDWEKHSTHPIGPTRKDPRNRNLTLNCLSCHRAHGTEYAHLMPTPTTTALCVGCHENLRR